MIITDTNTEVVNNRPQRNGELKMFGAFINGVSLSPNLQIALLSEIMALKAERLGMIYVTILACEVGLIALLSCLFFGESFSGKELAGCLLIVIGTGLAWA